ncbi:hypothetical protein AVEN_17195-1 [Araneus ventricosus]|uniref:Uncharacterized protein n=1 Tax=Araneus ventricosus TaxID=182803 RepID=A0A4Y2DTJ6_ARAVE|nr:hypothetical protein AVEN_17195-1 [Araneus ventricosus]
MYGHITYAPWQLQWRVRCSTSKPLEYLKELTDSYIITLLSSCSSHVHPTGSAAVMASGTGTWGGILSSCSEKKPAEIL